MNTTAINRYLTMRIHENAAWYAQKNRLNNAFDSYYHDGLFRTVNLASMLSLSEGHTLIILPKQHMASPARTLLAPVIDDLAVYAADERFLFDFDELFWQVKNCQNDEQFAQIFQIATAKFQQIITQDKTAITKRNVSVFELLAIFRDLLEVYYLLAVKLGDDVDAFADFMLGSRFFIEQGGTSDAPIIMKNTDKALYLWSNRAYHAEMMAMGHIWRLCAAKVEPFPITQLPDGLNYEQRQAVLMVSQQSFAIITGGPGTGKTHTVAQIVLALVSQNPNIDLALAAPTGKAAQRMSESLQAALGAVAVSLPEPKTIHRLLGIGRHGAPHYHADNPLPHDFIIVDEASMLGAELSCHLLAAVKTGARLILLGDAHQLAAVEAGAVLADLCRVPSLQSHRVHLVESRRFHADSDVGRLAKFINEADDGNDKAVQAVSLMESCTQLAFINISKNTNYYNDLTENYQKYFDKTKELLHRFKYLNDIEKQQQVRLLIDILNQYRVLTASHIGMAGDIKINECISRAHRLFLKTKPSASAWYHGRVVMVRANRYDLGLYNGDVGVCLRDGGELVVYFDGKSLKKISVGMLGGETVATAYAMTVHKSQGSEFDAVAVVFDDSNSRLLSKELAYTAVTRAKKSVKIYSTLPALQMALSTPTQRTTGLELFE